MSLFYITTLLRVPSFPQVKSKTFYSSTVKMDRVPFGLVAILSIKATLIIKIEHKFVLFNRFGLNFASVGRHSIKRIPFFFSSSPHLFLSVEQLVKA